MDSVSKTLDIEGTLTKLGNYMKTSEFWISVVIVISAVILWRLFKRFRRKWKERNGGLSTASNVVFDLIKYLFFFLLFVFLLQINGINVSALLTGLGVVSVIVGLSLQDFLKDIVMGVHILSDKFFQVGDVVRYNGTEGKVISFNVRTTKLELIDYNEILTISNRNITEIMVLNDMFDLDVDIAYYIDPATVHGKLGELAVKIGQIEGVSRTMYKGTQAFKDSSTTYRIRYWTPPDKRRNDVRRAALRIVQDGLWEIGITPAYSHLEVEYRSSTSEDRR